MRVFLFTSEKQWKPNQRHKQEAKDFCPGSNLGSMRARQYTYRHKYRDYVLNLWSTMQTPGCSRHFFNSLSLQSLHPCSLGHFLAMMTLANWTVLLYKPLYPVQGNLAAFKHSRLPVPSTRQILGIPKPSCSVNTHWCQLCPNGMPSGHGLITA